MSKRQSTTNNVAPESERVAWAQLESKGPSLVAKGQFQGPEIPIGSLLSLIGWEILINEMHLDFSWWIHSAANLNPSTYYCLESYWLWLVWPPQRSASNNFFSWKASESKRCPQNPWKVTQKNDAVSPWHRAHVLMYKQGTTFQGIFFSFAEYLWGKKGKRKTLVLCHCDR